jgi:hypothetical protein
MFSSAALCECKWGWLLIRTLVFFILQRSQAFHTRLCLTSATPWAAWLSVGGVGGWLTLLDDLWPLLLRWAGLDADAPDEGLELDEWPCDRFMLELPWWWW